MGSEHWKGLVRVCCELHGRLAAEHASTTARGPATLRVGLIDALHNLTEEAVVSGVRLAYR